MNEWKSKSEAEKKLTEQCMEKAGVGKRIHGKTLALMPMALILLSFSALAESETTTTTSGITTVMSSMDNITTLCSNIWSLLSGNEYFALYLAIGLLGAGLGLFRRAKKTARR